MTELTNAEIELLRGKPHNTKLWLSIYQPTTILACQVYDAGITTRERLITYDNVTEGSHLLVQNGMTMLVGSSAGKFDKGIVRVRSATDSVITVAENSDIEWENNLYLTILNYYEINAIFPRIIQDPSDEMNTIWYKDYDIAYTNQNDVLGSFICMGSHYAGFLGGTGTCSVYYSATGTHDLFLGSGTYNWFFEGAEVTGSSLLTPGWIYYSSPGHYTTTLVVSGSAGGIDRSYRHVSIYDRPDEGTNTPLLSWELTKLSGNREQGGYTASIKIFEDVSDMVIRDGSLVVIFADDWFGDGYENISIGGSQENRESIVFSGYVVNGTIKYDYKSSTVEFDVESPTLTAQKTVAFAVSITDSDSPSDDAANNPEDYPSAWVLVKNLDVKRGLYHYLRWHSTLLMCADFKFEASDRAIYGQDFDRTSIYDAANTFMHGTLHGRIVSDRQGKIWAEREIYIYPPYYSTGTMTVDKRDWVGEPEVLERMTEEVSFVEMGGVNYDGSVETSTPYLAGAPGLAPGYRGGVERIQGLALQDQAELNILAGYYFRYRNVRYPNLTFDVAGNYRNYEIAPQEIYPIHIDAEDTRRNIDINIAASIKSLDFKYDPSGESFRPKAVFTELPQPFVAETIPIPEIPPDDTDGDIIIPPPPPPPPPIIPPIITGTVQGTTVAYYCSQEGTGSANGGLYRTDDFTASGDQPTWSQVATLANATYMYVDEYDPTYVYLYVSGAGGEIYRYTHGGGLASVLTSAQAKTLTGDPENGSLKPMAVDRNSGALYAMWGGGKYTADKARVYILKSTTHGDSWTVQNPLGIRPTMGAQYIDVIDQAVWITVRAGLIGGGQANVWVSLSDGADLTWVGSATGLGLYGNAQIQIDPSNRLAAFAAGSNTGEDLYKCEAIGGTVQLTLIKTGIVQGSRVDCIWINPENSNHQRSFLAGAYRETFNQWNSVAYTQGITVANLVAGKMRNTTDGYDWWTYATKGDDLYAAVGNGETPELRMGDNHATPPYTDSIPEDVFTSAWGLWNGGSVS